MSRSPARPIALLGYMGSGKSAVATAVARLTGRAAVDLDSVVEERAGRPISAIFAEGGEPAFRRLETEALADHLSGEVVMALGGGAVLDDGNWRLVRERSVSIWLDAPIDVLWRRGGGDPKRPLSVDREAFERVYEQRLPRYREADHRVAADRPLGEVAEEVVRRCAG